MRTNTQKHSIAEAGTHATPWRVERSQSGTRWVFDRPVSRIELLAVAEEAILDGWASGPVFSEPESLGKFFQCRLAARPSEVFSVMFMDSRHRMIACEDLFHGSIAGAEVHPRVVVRRALELNAAAVAFAHNHPSGVAEPSTADRSITMRLRDALAIVDVRVLDHFVVGATVTSFAARGLL